MCRFNWTTVNYNSVWEDRSNYSRACTLTERKAGEWLAADSILNANISSVSTKTKIKLEYSTPHCMNTKESTGTSLNPKERGWGRRWSPRLQWDGRNTSVIIINELFLKSKIQIKLLKKSTRRDQQTAQCLLPSLSLISWWKQRTASCNWPPLTHAHTYTPAHMHKINEQNVIKFKS